MKYRFFLAIDIGATSGRAVYFSFDGNILNMEEIYRFPNAILNIQDKYYWDVYQLYGHIKEALRVCASRKLQIDSMGIDTWGVDVGYLAKDGTLLGLPRAYRDPYTAGVSEEFFKEMKAATVYEKTGIQTMDINTLFQLYSARKEKSSQFLEADDILFVPDLLAYFLTGKRVCEQTIASTSQLLNPYTKEFDQDILKVLGIDPGLLHRPIEPGTTIGTLSPSIAQEVGLPEIPVVAVAGHDTASAIVAVPAKNKNFAYLSSGTWSLMGIESDTPIITESSFRHNFTNEGGIEGTTRFLKNITGMWILEQCRKEWAKEGRDYSYPEIVEMAKNSAFTSLIQPDDPRFANPASMIRSIYGYCEETGQALPEGPADVMSCIFNSLAQRYKEVFGMLESLSPYPLEVLHVIGGGAQNDYLNQLTADAIGCTVIAGPSEATSLGNALVQAKAVGLVQNRWEMRKIVMNTTELKEFKPKK